MVPVFIQKWRKNKLTLDRKLQMVKSRVKAIEHPNKVNKRAGLFRNFI